MSKSTCRKRKLDGLSASSAALYRSVTEESEFGSGELALLIQGLEARDRYLQAKEQVDREGLTYTDRFGSPHPHPAVAIAAGERLAFLRTLQTLRVHELETV